jgi:glyoxylate/hydroxypyruvate reductase A
MTLLFKPYSPDVRHWVEAFERLAPDLEVRIWPEVGAVEDIDYALVWDMPHGALASYPGLRAIFSLGAGVDHLFGDESLPAHVPITRTVDPNMTSTMVEYVLCAVLGHHRNAADYIAHHREGVWRQLPQRAAWERHVGIMGLGALGGAAARMLVDFGFDVAGWCRTEREADGVEIFVGADGLTPFLRRTEILVCLLPLTPETEGIVDTQVLAALPEGAAFINVARGRHHVEEDLLAALDMGRLSGATLDVFEDEPLAPDHPFWKHPKVLLTPHIAADSDTSQVVGAVIENIRRSQTGEPLLNPVDWEAGY